VSVSVCVCVCESLFVICDGSIAGCSGI